MIEIIYYLEKNLDRFEKLYSEDYLTRKGYEHNKIYFDVVHKFISDEREFTFEACLMMVHLEPPTRNGVRFHREGSFDCKFVCKGKSEQEVIDKIINRIEIDETIYQKENA